MAHVSQGFDTAGAAGQHDAVDDGTGFGSVRSIAEQPGFSSSGPRPDGALNDVAIRHVAIGAPRTLGRYYPVMLELSRRDRGGERIANVLTIIETVKLQGHNPEVYLTDVLTRIQDHPKDRLEDLLPWNWTPARARHEAA